MTRHLPPGATPPDSDADRLSATWNEIVAEGRPADQFDRDLIETVRAVHASASGPLPDPAFTTNLREKLMDMTLPASGTGARPTARECDTPLRLPRPVRGSFTRRWTAIAATIALLLATLLASYASGLIPRSNDPEPTSIGAPFHGTPTAGTPQADLCTKHYWPFGGNTGIGVGHVGGTAISPTDLAVSQAQMQGWELDGGKSVSFSDPMQAISGVAIDIVISGAYQATFSVPVVVSNSYPGGGIDYPDANSLVELSSGDSVTYPISTSHEVTNPFTSKMLKFKTILFTEGDPSVGNRQATGDFRYRVDGGGDARLTKPLADYVGTGGAMVFVTYESPAPGCRFPPEGVFADLVLGPVASVLAGGGPDQGFAVWIATGAG